MYLSMATTANWKCLSFTPFLSLNKDDALSDCGGVTAFQLPVESR